MKPGPEQARTGAVVGLLISALFVAICIYFGGHRLQDAYMYYFTERHPFEKVSSTNLKNVQRATGMMGRGRGEVLWIVSKDNAKIAILSEKLPPEFYLVRSKGDDGPIGHIAGIGVPAYIVVQSPTRFLLGELFVSLLVGVTSGYLFIGCWKYLRNPDLETPPVN